jgi:ATP-dependent DNA helicase RecG
VADLARDSSLLPAVAETAETLLSLDPKSASRLVARWIGSSVRYAEA